MRFRNKKAKSPNASGAGEKKSRVLSRCSFADCVSTVVQVTSKPGFSEVGATGANGVPLTTVLSFMILVCFFEPRVYVCSFEKKSSREYTQIIV